MSAKVPDDVRLAVIREFKKGDKSKAGLAREYNVSVSTIYRILRAEPVSDGVSTPGRAPPKGVTGSTGFGNPGPGGNSEKSPPNLFSSIGLSEEDASKLIAIVKEVEGAAGTDMDAGAKFDLVSLFGQFSKWLKARDEKEKEKIRVMAELDSLKLERSSLENRLTILGSKAATMEIVIGKMKKEAEEAVHSLSRVEEDLSGMERRLERDKSLIFMAAGLKSIIERGEIDSETLSMMSEFKGLWMPDEDEILGRLRDSMLKIFESASTQLRNWSAVTDKE